MRSLLRRSVMVGSALSVATMTLLNGAPPAHATPTSGYIVAAGGSDTTEKVMNSIMNHELNNGGNGAGGGRSLPTPSAGTVTVKTYNIPTRPGISSPSSPYVVPGESDGTAGECPSDVNWVDDPAHQGNNGGVSTEGLAPNGSGAGATYLKNEHNGGVNGHTSCIDIGRSSGGPGAATGGDPSTFQYYAFALDAVSWATTSLKAPPTLTTAELQSIYTCQVTNWKNLATHKGTDGQIQRYLPNPSSGTRKFFLTDVLQLAVNNSVPSSSTTFNENATTGGDGGACPAVKGDGFSGSGTIIEENEATQIDLGDKDKAILPFSAGQWVFQAAGEGNPTIDQRNGARLGGTVALSGANNSAVMWGATDGIYELNTAAAETANGGTISGVVDEANVKAENGNVGESGGTYPGIRFVYNILDSGGDTRAYQGGMAVVGMDNTPGGTFKSPLCSGSSNFERSAISSFGFAPLPTSGGGSHNNNATSCRLLP